MILSENLAQLRREYRHARLDETMIARDPFTQFQRWLDEALAAALPTANAMTLATVDAQRRPAARIVLLKQADNAGFVFYTNYDSHKGQALAANPHASLLFYWAELERQVRIEGVVEKTTAQEADAYFQQRPLGSRHAALASPQSTVVPDRAALERRYAEVIERYGAQPPRPAHWGGYRLIPQTLEFWQGRENRLHDRLLYRRSENPDWIVERLAP